jgi:predicted RNA binding protein YcfA (HicA-like mRNA interferase family)
LPVLNGREVVRALTRAGFVEHTRTGSHLTFVHPETQDSVTVPVHGGHDLKAGTLRAIIRDAGMSVARFRELL